ncbi:translesion DNA synthesis-associated protein ImuA [Glaciecola sp. XM2]|jgi:cell division inhibitor SulA|uniref:translesion DNA synthesis-associated protein ImuA n=1 Tax=Glaciecola sp. XM2 TaxID=1914931 RepID=UPI001BDF1DA7|nr:translesion DNA synthesis-associated protein ImuA [Glaciecola sp. XM2]MBT1451916.1 translesion DNA synthesis-associated protein ImuA [Glaciecola sp. XM2]
MNPILHELKAKQWIWNASNSQGKGHSKRLTTGYEALDSVLSGGFPSAGMIHINSYLGCGELRLILSILRQMPQHEVAQANNKLRVFIAPPFQLNAEFLLDEKIALEHLLVIKPATQEEALWSAEQCAKSGVCEAVFLWQNQLKHTQIRKLELAALHGQCHCFWFDNNRQCMSNLPLTLSLLLSRENEQMQIKVNKQKVGWAKPAINIKLPFKSRTQLRFKEARKAVNNIVQLRATP